MGHTLDGIFFSPSYYNYIYVGLQPLLSLLLPPVRLIHGVHCASAHLYPVFDILRYRMEMLFIWVPMVVKGNVALGRINDFLYEVRLMCPCLAISFLSFLDRTLGRVHRKC